MASNLIDTETPECISSSMEAFKNQEPNLSIPSNTISKESLSMLDTTFFAERIEISCSTDLPPYKIATLSLSFILIFTLKMMA